jgi:hypothetical protein
LGPQENGQRCPQAYAPGYENEFSIWRGNVCENDVCDAEKENDVVDVERPNDVGGVEKPNASFQAPNDR